MVLRSREWAEIQADMYKSVQKGMGCRGLRRTALASIAMSGPSSETAPTCLLVKGCMGSLSAGASNPIYKSKGSEDSCFEKVHVCLHPQSSHTEPRPILITAVKGPLSALLALLRTFLFGSVAAAVWREPCRTCYCWSRAKALTSAAGSVDPELNSLLLEAYPSSLSTKVF